jgi:hypothetical protein
VDEFELNFLWVFSWINPGFPSLASLAGNDTGKKEGPRGDLLFLLHLGPKALRSGEKY